MGNIKPFCVNMSSRSEDEIRNLHKMCLEAEGYLRFALTIEKSLLCDFEDI